ncbi:MAG: hypothetical protein IJX53_00875 [Clostridia bacterium]|nr:hypothetical protein [Clostridia bacterium]
MKPINSETNRKQELIAKRLEQYRTYQTMLALRDQPVRASDRVLIGMRVREIEREVRALPVGRERLLLELHYFEGHSIERCAELMYISRATAFRVRRRAFALLAENEQRRAIHA